MALWQCKVRISGEYWGRNTISGGLKPPGIEYLPRSCQRQHSSIHSTFPAKDVVLITLHNVRSAVTNSQSSRTANATYTLSYIVRPRPTAISNAGSRSGADDPTSGGTILVA